MIKEEMIASILDKIIESLIELKMVILNGADIPKPLPDSRNISIASKIEKGQIKTRDENDKDDVLIMFPDQSKIVVTEDEEEEWY